MAANTGDGGKGSPILKISIMVTVQNIAPQIPEELINARFSFDFDRFVIYQLKQNEEGIIMYNVTEQRYYGSVTLRNRGISVWTYFFHKRVVVNFSYAYLCKSIVK